MAKELSASSISCTWITERCFCRTWLNSGVGRPYTAFSLKKSQEWELACRLLGGRENQEGRRRWEAGEMRPSVAVSTQLQSHLHFSPAELTDNILRVLPATRYFQEMTTQRREKGRRIFLIYDQRTALTAFREWVFCFLLIPVAAMNSQDTFALRNITSFLPLDIKGSYCSYSSGRMAKDSSS